MQLITQSNGTGYAGRTTQLRRSQEFAGVFSQLCGTIVRSPAGYAGDLAMTTQPFSELETVGCLIIAMNARTDIKFCHFTPPGISMP